MPSRSLKILSANALALGAIANYSALVRENPRNLLASRFVFRVAFVA